MVVASSEHTCRLRPAIPADESFLAELFALDRAQEFVAAGLDGPALATILQVQYQGQQTTYRGQFPNAEFLVVEREGTPIGRLVLDRGDERITIVDIVITPAERQRGLGTALLTRILAEADASGAVVDLRVAVGNPALALYQRLGFTITSTSETHTSMARVTRKVL